MHAQQGRAAGLEPALQRQVARDIGGPARISVTDGAQRLTMERRAGSAPFTAVRWLPPGLAPEVLDALPLPTGARLALDQDQQPVALFPSEWSVGYFAQNNPNVPLSLLAPM